MLEGDYGIISLRDPVKNTWGGAFGDGLLRIIPV